MVELYPALDVKTPTGSQTINSLLEALLDDFNPFAIEINKDSSKRIYFFSAIDRDHALEAITSSFSLKTILVESVDVPNENWAERSQASLRAIKVGNTIIAPPWDIPKLSDNKITVIVIKPSMGFGTGHHASTRLCLHALQDIDLKNRFVIDVGTGSAILSIAAAKQGAKRVFAIDTDSQAIETASENVHTNNVIHLVQLEHKDVRLYEGLEKGDVVMANVSAAIICQETATFLRLLKNQGILIVGGLMASEESQVIETLKHFAICKKRYSEDEWLSLVFQCHA